MLPPFIIEQIRKREEEERRSHQQDQPRLDIPMDVHRPAAPRETEEDREIAGPRGCYRRLARGRLARSAIQSCSVASLLSWGESIVIASNVVRTGQR